MIELYVPVQSTRKPVARFYSSLGLTTHIESSTVHIMNTDHSRIIPSPSGFRVELHPSLLPIPHPPTDPLGNHIHLVPSGPPIRIGILTSGGDAAGMNAVIRSSVETAIRNGIRIYGIYKGYQGLIDGNIHELDCKFKLSEYSEGGTQLLSMRCNEFLTQAGLHKAAKQLLAHQISKLIVLGGDGTFRGILELEKEYNKLITDQIHADQSDQTTDHSISFDQLRLKAIAIPATIDNDFIMPSTLQVGLPTSLYTIGCNSALHRIIEVIDRISSTIKSHRRIFVLECMGRNCGWLTMMSGFAADADFILLPEVPYTDWQLELSTTIKKVYKNNKEIILVLICEGAVDIDGNKIGLDECKTVVQNAMNEEGMVLDVRTLKIGHIQRGGPPSALDRILGREAGANAVKYLLGSKAELAYSLITRLGVVHVPLASVVEEVERQSSSTKLLMQRDELMQRAYKNYEKHRTNKICSDQNNIKTDQISRNTDQANTKTDQANTKTVSHTASLKYNIRVGIVYNGISVDGTNSFVNMLVQIGNRNRMKMVYFENGLDGLNRVREASEYQFSNGNGLGGVMIRRSKKKVNIEKINKKISKAGLDCIVVIGGEENRKWVKEIKKGILVLVGENELSERMNELSERMNELLERKNGLLEGIGFDTALNAIIRAADNSRIGNGSLRRGVTFMEIKAGERVGMLAGKAAGALAVIGREGRPITKLKMLRERVLECISKDGPSNGLIIGIEGAFGSTGLAGIAELIRLECRCRVRVVSVSPYDSAKWTTPADRIAGNFMADKVIELVKSGCYSGMLGWNNGECSFAEL